MSLYLVPVIDVSQSGTWHMLTIADVVTDGRVTGVMSVSFSNFPVTGDVWLLLLYGLKFYIIIIIGMCN